MFSDGAIRTHFFKEKNNSRAELYGAIHALQTFLDEHKERCQVELFCDGPTLTNLLERREKLEATDFISVRKKATLPNADLYKLFFSLIDQLQPAIHQVGEEWTDSKKNFHLLDKQVRKELRTLVKKKLV